MGSSTEASGQSAVVNVKKTGQDVPPFGREVKRNNQIFASFIACLSMTTCGCCYSKSSFILPQLENPDNDIFSLTSDEASWYASFLMIGCTCGALLGAFQSDKFGRRISLALDNLLFVMGSAAETFAPNFTVLMIGRFLTGVASGSCMVSVPMYISEISQASLRGLTSSLNMTGFSSGFATILTLGAFLNWRVSVGITALVPFVALVGLKFCPESPVWLVRKDRLSEATQALVFLRGDDDVIAFDLERIQRNLAKKDKAPQLTLLQEVKANFTDMSFIRPFLLCLGMVAFALDCSVLPPLAFYMVKIFETSGLNLNPFWTASAVAWHRAITAILASTMTQGLNRRPLFFGNALLMSLSTFTLALYSYVSTHELISPELEWPKWVPLICVFLIYTAFSSGFATICYSVSGEMLPAKVRSFGTGLIGFLDNLVLFGVTKVTPTLINNLGVHGMLACSLTVTTPVLAAAFFFMPETQGVSLEEIEQSFRRKRPAEAEGDGQTPPV